MRSSFGDNMGPTVKDSPPSSPGSESMGSGPTASGRRKRPRTNESVAGAGGSSGSQAQVSQGQSQQQQPPQQQQQQPQQQGFSSSSAYNSSPMESKYQPKEEKESKLFDNGVNAPHMLGNQLNPSSSMAQKMSDTLSQEMKAHSIFTEASNPGVSLVGPPLHSRVIASAKAGNQAGASAPSSFSSVFAGAAGSNSGALASGNIPQTLDQLLERQWEQGSQFLMDQAQHFDIASLLSCLHQLRAENLRLEENVNTLLQRRDHLLAVNARLAIPLTSPPNNSKHTGCSARQQPSTSQNPPAAPPSRGTATSELTTSCLTPHAAAAGHAAVVENGMPANSTPAEATPAQHAQFGHRPASGPPQQSTTIRHASGGSIYQGQANNLMAQAGAGSSGHIRNASVDMMRNIQR